MENEKGIESVWDSVINRKANTYDAFSKREKNKDKAFMLIHTKKNGGTKAKGFN